MDPVNCTASELSIYLRALAAGFLPTFYSDTNPSALSSSMAIASKSWRNGKRTGHFPGFPCLPMSVSSTASPGADSSMSSPEDFPARTSAWPERAPELTASGRVSGEKWRGSLAKYDRDSHSWKTAQHSLIEDWAESLETWPRSGTTVDGQLYLLPTLAPRTGASASGLWLPTPCTVDSGSMFNRSDSPGAALRPTLGAMVRFALWPTPHGFSADGRSNGPSGNELGRAVNQSLAWPTPTSSLGTKGGRVTERKSREGGTPTARDWESGKASEATHAKNSRPLSEQIGGSLSPDWVELLMGWPKGWTSLEPMSCADMRGWGDGWEDDTPRVAIGTPNRVSRLKAIGNGQVPLCAATAWEMLS